MHRAVRSFAAGAVSLVLLSAATAQTIISTSGGRMTDYNRVVTGRTASWTQTNRFTNVTVSARLCCGDGYEETAPTLAYLTTRIGFGTTTNDTIASTQIVIVSEAVSNVVLFSGLTLEPGTHYLTLLWGLGGWVSGCAVDLEYALGVTLGPEYELTGPEFYGSGVRELEPTTPHFSVVSGTNLIYAPVPTNVVNTWPVATPQQITVIENTPMTFRLDVLDADGDPLEVRYYAMPTNGTVRAEGVANDPDDMYDECFPLTELTYTPVENYVGSDYLEYTIMDWHEASFRGAPVTIEVVPPPLGIARIGDSLRLSWTANCPHYEVERASSLDGPWQGTEALPSLDGDQLAELLSPSESQKFFRLRRTITP